MADNVKKANAIKVLLEMDTADESIPLVRRQLAEIFQEADSDESVGISVNELYDLVSRSGVNRTVAMFRGRQATAKRKAVPPLDARGIVEKFANRHVASVSKNIAADLF